VDQDAETLKYHSKQAPTGRHTQDAKCLQGQVNEPSPLEVWESVGQEAIPSWGQDVTYLSQMGPSPAPHVPPPPPTG
jgi:hypothetical protein